jgi:plasmid maintenance system antidote protein VapI
MERRTRPQERDGGDRPPLARVFGNSSDFWLNVQRHTDHSPKWRERIERARPLKAA